MILSSVILRPEGQHLHAANGIVIALEKIQIEDLHWHDLRHVCFRLAQAGVDPYTIRD